MIQATKTRIISMILAFVTVICTVFMAVQTPLIARAEGHFQCEIAYIAGIPQFTAYQGKVGAAVAGQDRNKT